MSDDPQPGAGPAAGGRFFASMVPRVALLLVLLYGFLVSIGMLSKSFKLFGGGYVDQLINDASNPLIGLFVGILITTLVQ